MQKNNMSLPMDKMRGKDHLMQSLNFNTTTISMNVCLNTAMTQKEYTNKDITVTWKPAICQHSTKCWKGLLQVFNPQNKPWINMSGATTERITEQVKKCPSGALSYHYNSEDPFNN